MKNYKTKIGEHQFIVIHDSSTIDDFLNKHYPNLLVCPNEKNMEIFIEEGYGIAFVNYEVEITREFNRIFYKRADYSIEVDSGFKKATIQVHDELALKHALMNVYSAFIVHHNWGLLIHSSCVIEDGKAHIFAGQSGAGKSTAARLSHPRELLSDEATLLKISPEGVTVFDSPFRSEINSRPTDETAPLASMQILNQALQNERICLKKADTLLHLMDKVFYWGPSPDETKKIMDLLKMLVEQVPAYELYFKKDPSFWELIS